MLESSVSGGMCHDFRGSLDIYPAAASCSDGSQNPFDFGVWERELKVAGAALTKSRSS